MGSSVGGLFGVGIVFNVFNIRDDSDSLEEFGVVSYDAVGSAFGCGECSVIVSAAFVDVVDKHCVGEDWFVERQGVRKLNDVLALWSYLLLNLHARYTSE